MAEHDKPIYYLALYITMPEITENGNAVGFPLSFGRIEFVEFNTRPIAEDIPLKPNETYTFKIAENYQKGWESHRLTENRRNPSKLVILFAGLSFGDGSGYDGTDAFPYPHRKVE